ncbi:279_t:CDS:2 [Cetraspora pellucida]|uniref:279_t:CDS:1 n=1 Tax=Cetraspora pellucida TaxID=1433469 RepID=A0A9N8Z7B8_9GLOM|nr:279_t:CDS:2 [Cetraspora pellucida]
MFEATFAKTLLFKYVIEATRELVTNVNIKFTESGINFSSMNSLHIVLIFVHFDKESFEKYILEELITFN